MTAAPDDDATPAGRPVDQFDLEIVEFVLCWAPYGGPPEDECVPRFGMPPDRLRSRFRDIVRNGLRRHLDADSKALLERAAKLPIDGEDEPSRYRGDRRAPMDRPVLRRGVWRWT